MAPLALAVGACVLVPFGVASWDVDADAWPWIAASVAFELAYFVLLGRAYARADLALVYPIARGSAPVLALVASVLIFGASLSVAAVLGVIAVGAGVVLVRGAAASRDALLALAVGACIAGYTVVDNEGVDHADPTAYLMLVMVPTAAIALALRRPTQRVTVRVGAAGVGMVGAYLLTLFALERAAAAPVAAVRETSVLFAVAFAAVVARERVSTARAVGAALVVAGVAALAAG